MKLTFFLSIFLAGVITEISCFECMLLNLKHGYKMIRESFQTKEHVSQLTCFYQCFIESRCKLASFYETDGICKFSELNFENSVTTIEDSWQLVEKPGK